MRFVDVELAGGLEEPRDLVGPGPDVAHPDERALACVDQVSARIFQRNHRHLSHHVLRAGLELACSPVSGGGGRRAVVDADDRPRTLRHQRDIVHPVPTLQMHHDRRLGESRLEQLQLQRQHRLQSRSLSQMLVVLPDVLLRSLLPSHPVSRNLNVHKSSWSPR
ncbi:hypothetical protein GCM10009744_17560 [Kribbella alba]|uniref:Uncharacterized protein n=1 Tax=Kribbella alba TaxID=190197 RepID=A0ABN2F492_9ACTN